MNVVLFCSDINKAYDKLQTKEKSQNWLTVQNCPPTLLHTAYWDQNGIQIKWNVAESYVETIPVSSWKIC